MTIPTTGETVSERPNFAEVLAEHQYAYGYEGIVCDGEVATLGCTCGWRENYEMPEDDMRLAEARWDAHRAKALEDSVDHWLADEGTRERVAVAFGWHLTERTYDSGCTLACGYDGDEMDDHLAAAALAALATPTVPTAEEER